MNCEMAQQAIALAHGLIDLPLAAVNRAATTDGTPLKHDPDSHSSGAADQLDELALHLEGCAACREEMAFHQALAQAIESTQVAEPSPTLVAQARARLDSALDTRPAPGPFSRFLLNLSFGLGRLRAVPVLTSALILLGLFTGAYTGYQAGRRAHMSEVVDIVPRSETDVAADSAPTRVAAVTGIVRGSDPEFVEVHFDRLVPDFVPGSLDDPSIRALLMMGARNAEDPSVRSDAVALLASECRKRHDCGATSLSAPAVTAASAAAHQPMLAALIASLHTDREPEVRITALHGLEPFVAQDVQVRNAVLETLVSDPDTAVRNEALRMLPPVQVDSSVRQVLHTVASRDGDPALRTASQQILNSGPQVQ